jgi:hypothetical protein
METMVRTNINVTCHSYLDPQRIPCEYKLYVQWVRICGDTIVASCGDFTVTFFCKDGDDDTRQYTRQNILVGMGVYANTLDVPEEIIKGLALGFSYTIEWPKIGDVIDGEIDTQTIDRSQRPIHRLAN